MASCSRPLEVLELTDADALSQLGPAIDALHTAVGAPITARRTWLQAWLDSRPRFAPLVVAVASSESELEAAAVLATRRRTGWTEVVAVGNGPSDRNVLPAREPGVTRLLAEGIGDALSRLRRPWTLSLAQLAAEDPTVHHLGRILTSATTSPGVSAPVLELDGRREPEAYAGRSYRQNLRTMRNRLARSGLELQLDWITEPVEVFRAALVTEQIRLERDHLERRPSTLRDPRYRLFRRIVLERLAHERAAELLLLRVGTNIAAYTVGLRDGSSYRLWDTAFASPWGRFGVGHLAVAETLRRALTDPLVTEFDFMRGMEGYKLRLANRVVESVSLEAWSSPRTRAATHFASSWRSRAYYRWIGRSVRARAGTRRGRQP